MDFQFGLLFCRARDPNELPASIVRMCFWNALTVNTRTVMALKIEVFAQIGIVMDTRVSISDLATSDRVWEAFVKIANESSRNEKIAMLERAKASANSLFCLYLAGGFGQHDYFLGLF